MEETTFPTEIKDKLALLVELTTTTTTDENTTTRHSAAEESKRLVALLVEDLYYCLIAADNNDGADADTVSKLMEGGAATPEGLVKILQRCDKNREQQEQSAHFYHRICGFVYELAGFGEETAVQFADSGIVPAVICVMESFPQDEFLLCTCVAVFAHMVPNLPLEKCIELIQNTSMLENIVVPLERQSARGRGRQQGEDAAKLFWFSCLALGPCLGGFKAIGWEKMEKRLFTRIINSVWSGILLHPADEEAQEIGRHLLRCLVGPKTAMEMIDHAEMHHCEDAECSCAA